MRVGVGLERFGFSRDAAPEPCWVLTGCEAEMTGDWGLSHGQLRPNGPRDSDSH